MRSFLAAILALGALAQDSDWWNPDWKYRRNVKITNNLKGKLTAGYPVSVAFSPAFMGIDKKARPDLEDLRVVYKGKEVPFIFERPEKDRVLVTFRLAQDMDPKASDTYSLYYGNPAAAKASHKKTDVYEFHNEWTRIEWDNRIDPQVVDGKLAVSRAPGEMCAFKLKDVKPLDSFELKMKLSFEVNAADASQTQFSVHLRSRKVEKMDAELEKKIDELIGKLGDDSYKVREEASRQLIEIGIVALPKLEKAMKESEDPEVKWRCEYIMGEMGKRSPIPEILVKYQFIPNAAKQTTFVVTSTIEGKTVTSQPMQMRDFTLQVTRMEKFGSVAIRTPGDNMVNVGEFKSPVDEVYFEVSNLKGAVLRIGELQLRRYLSDQGRPTFEIDIEQSAK